MRDCRCACARMFLVCVILLLAPITALGAEIRISSFNVNLHNEAVA